MRIESGHVGGRGNHSQLRIDSGRVWGLGSATSAYGNYSQMRIKSGHNYYNTIHNCRAVRIYIIFRYMITTPRSILLIYIINKY